MSVLLQALCCVCGTLRTCRRPRNYCRENYWLRGPLDRDWHRETGDLKCEQCGQVTTHAIILPENDFHRDHAERLTRLALGSTTDPVANEPSTRTRVQAAYRQGRQVNPHLHHVWAAADEAAAREAGQDYVYTYCGEKLQIPKTSKSVGGCFPVKPSDVEAQPEYDPETDLSWVEMDCVDCYLALNQRRMAHLRKLLKRELVWLVKRVDRADQVPDNQVEALIRAFVSSQPKREQRSERQ